ncbi:MAG TPA: hypothetical protein VFW66_08340 [Gemmatimonadales bacterium]|nr:hypothetical protein [Gemmatimonadales bacterium]
MTGGTMANLRELPLTVIKLGGGLMRIPGALDLAARAIASAARRRPLIVVPGGGPFADAVRTLDAALGLSPSTAHWMAILAMDQYACVIADRLDGGCIAWEREGIREALAAGKVPVLAPFRWMRAADVLPHSWDVTGDSIAAFVSGALDADLLVLLKPIPGGTADLVDRGFSEVLPAGVRAVVLGPAELDRLEEVLAR